jgi:hypothetical protein
MQAVPADLQKLSKSPKTALLKQFEGSMIFLPGFDEQLFVARFEIR